MLFKYETLFKGPYNFFQMWKNGSVKLKMAAVTTRVNICRIKTYENNTEEANVFNQYRR